MDTFRKSAIQVKDKIFYQSKDQAKVDFNGWKIEAIRIYHQKAFRFAWTPCYYLYDLTGNRYGGYNRLSSFISWAKRFIKEKEK